MVAGVEWFKDASDLHKSVVIAIAIALIACVYILVSMSSEERYTSLYLYPESYANYPEGSMVSFTYGIRSFERETVSYAVNIYVDDSLKKTQNIELTPGDVYEEEITLDITGVNLPARIRVELLSPYNRYETYFWIKRGNPD